MATYDSYEKVGVEVPRSSRKHRHHHHHHDDDRDRDYDEPRYVETRETYVRGTAPLDPGPYPSRDTDLMLRRREDSDLSVEEVRREFPPPGAGAYVQTRGMGRDERYDGRSRSMERGSKYGDYLDDPRSDRRSHRKIIKEEIIEPRHRSLSRNQKILAGVAGAALAVGGKELWDRRKNGGQPPEDRNLIATAALAAGGAFAGYEGAELIDKQVEKRRVKKDIYLETSGRRGDPAEYYESDSDREKKKSRRKSIIEGALGLAGLGAAAKAADRDRDDRSTGRRSRRGSDSGDSRTSRRRDKSRGGDDKSEGLAKIQQAAKAALLAGATEAFRVRNEPGGWAGAKGKRVLTAAIGAGGIDAAADRDPDHHSKRHILEAVIGGLAGNRLIHGSRSELEVGKDGRGGRSRSRSRGPSGSGAGLAALATAGLGALAAKKISDRSRSRNRDDDYDDDDRRSHRRRSGSDDGYDEKPRRKRSKSVTDYARKGLAALGIGEAADAAHDDRRRDREVVEETRETRKYRKHRDRDRSDDSSDDEYDSRRGGRGSNRDRDRDRDSDDGRRSSKR